MDEDDVEILVPGSEEEEERRMRLHAKEVKSVIAKIGITQTVLGFALIIGGIIILASFPYWEVGNLAEGIWCGVFVVISGPLSIAAYCYLHLALVITCLVMNILSSLLLFAGMVMAAVSTFENSFRTSYRHNAISWTVGFMTLNIILVCCFTLSIYITVIYIKILVQKRDNYCSWFKQDQHSNYTMVYVPTSAHVPEYMKNIPSGTVESPVPNSTALSASDTPMNSRISPHQ